ncbi:hypothetical protein ANN_02515 [Periplaneta americana]|uniref:Uncharacterized protein n=1 Tax=Periplaneta americana TaxID=6978 RepID=A0ABQ8TWH4_PERAM|nr:hypothetical protein ANN_02515 [Periplaneta americana]
MIAERYLDLELLQDRVWPVISFSAGIFPHSDNLSQPGFEPGLARFKVRRANRYSTAVDNPNATTYSKCRIEVDKLH